MPAPKSHGHCANRTQTPVYTAWLKMNRRCHNPLDREYRLYGARGISVCPQWRESFAQFAADMGERPEGTSIDRINNDSNYEPGNCRWATNAQQQLNKRGPKLTQTDVAGIKKLLRTRAVGYLEIASLFGVSRSLVQAINLGGRWSHIS